jgi:hypothetical protein
MDTAQSTLPRQTPCDACGESTPDYDIVHFGSIERGYRRLCSRCINTQMAEAAGLEGFQHARLEPVGLTDCLGKLHTFHFRTHLFATGVAIDAFELRDGNPTGYFFQIIGEPETDLLVLLAQLVGKMRRALSIISRTATMGCKSPSMGSCAAALSRTTTTMASCRCWLSTAEPSELVVACALG